MSKNSYALIKKALALLNQEEPNILFFAGDVRTEYLMFYECDYEDIKDIEDELEKLKVVYIGKYECLGIERFNLYDYTFENR